MPVYDSIMRTRPVSPDNKSQSDRVLNLPLVSELPCAQGFTPSTLPPPATRNKIYQTGFLPIAQLETHVLLKRCHIYRFFWDSRVPHWRTCPSAVHTFYFSSHDQATRLTHQVEKSLRDKRLGTGKVRGFTLLQLLDIKLSSRVT